MLKLGQNLRFFRNSYSLMKPIRFFATSKQDVVVVGSGPGGYVAAIKAGQLGMKVTCVEKRKTLGGTCLNVGCIPSKSLLNISHFYHNANHNFSKFGINLSNLSINVKKMIKAKKKSVDMLTSGIQHLFRKNNVNWAKGTCKIVSPNEVHVKKGSNVEKILTDKIIIATGSSVAKLPEVEIDEKDIVSSTGALEFEKVPKKLVVIGAGVIGLELGSVWSRLGSEVTVVEFLDRIVPNVDMEIAKNFQKILKSQGLKFKLATKVTSVHKQNDSLVLKTQPAKGGSESHLEADKVLVSIGRVPYTENLGLEQINVEMDGRFIKVDSNWETNVKGIYAIGDVIKGPQLAHKAEEEGIAVIERIKGIGGHVNYDTIPGVIYTNPEVAQIGKTEEELKAINANYKVGKFPFLANSRAKTVDDYEGMVKILADAKSDKILGIHIIGAEAGELIHEGCLAMEYGASSEDIARTCHAHPTRSEAMKEAAMATYDKAIHF